MAPTTTTEKGNAMTTDHGYSTIGYRVRNVRDAARILDRYRVTGSDRVRAVRSLHRDGRATVPIPTGRLVLNKRG